MNSETTINSKLTLIKGNTLSCRDFEYLYQDYMDGNLSDMLMMQMKHRLDFCPECQSYASDIEYLVQQARLLLKERPLPSDTKERIHKKLNEEFDLNLA